MRALVLALGVLLWAGAVAAQPASLVADRIDLSGDGAVTATGSVEVLFRDTRLTATSVRYEAAGERLIIEGPITLTTGDDVLFLADAAELDPDLRAGILDGARLILDRQLQLAARRIRRSDDRYTELVRVVSSSCRICEDGDTPLWEIRAERVIHDEETRQLYFENAQFRVAGLTIGALPRLRMPGPGVERATGLLFPEIRTSTLLGPGLRTPYFVTLGPHADLRLTPYVSNVTSTLEAVYRHELTFGRIDARGAVSDDTLTGDERAYLFADAVFFLPRDFLLRFDLELVSDPAYLIDYGYSNKDRLDSAISVERTRANEDIFAAATAFRTLRGPDLAIKDQITRRYLEFGYTRRLPAPAFGGAAWLTLDGAALTRTSEEDALGRDVARIGGEVAWRRALTFGPGIVAAVETGLRGDVYFVDQDAAFETVEARATPAILAELRWPLGATGPRGASHLVEPVIQIAWSESYGGPVPNEDSGLVEFDEGNLLSLSRYPGTDLQEEGLRAALGVSWTRNDPGGWSSALTLGRVFRLDDVRPPFAESTGLTGTSSDWLIALRYDVAGQLRVSNRALLDDELSFSRAEARVAWRGERTSLSSTYTYLEADPAEERPEPVSELTLDAAYRLDRNWTTRANLRYDTDEGQAARAGLTVNYQNECVGVDLSVSRRFTSSATVRPSTDFAFRVSLAGIGTGPDGRDVRRSCRG